MRMKLLPFLALLLTITWKANDDVYLVKNFRAFETGGNGTKISWESLRKIQKNCWISWTRTHKPKIPEIPGARSHETEILDKKFSKLSLYLTRYILFSGKFRSIFNGKFPEIKTGILKSVMLCVSTRSICLRTICHNFELRAAYLELKLQQYCCTGAVPYCDRV